MILLSERIFLWNSRNTQVVAIFSYRVEGEEAMPYIVILSAPPKNLKKFQLKIFCLSSDKMSYRNNIHTDRWSDLGSMESVVSIGGSKLLFGVLRTLFMRRIFSQLFHKISDFGAIFPHSGSGGRKISCFRVLNWFLDYKEQVCQFSVH